LRQERRNGASFPLVIAWVSPESSYKENLLGALTGLVGETEIIIKAAEKGYLAYLKSTAEDVAENPELVQAIIANKDAMLALVANEDIRRAIFRALAANIAGNEAALRAIAANEDAMRKLLGPELFEVWKKTRPH
jgi:hypothetical protein